jgi:hypothetical protein
MSPEAFEAKRQIMKLWTRSKNEPPEQGMLFGAGSTRLAYGKAHRMSFFQKS